LQKYFFIAIGGSLGAIARYWVGTTVSGQMGTHFPFGTLLINISACLLIGISLEFLNRRTNINPSFRFFFPIGFIGAYSTFSTFEWDTLAILHSGAYWLAIVYVVASVISGFIAVGVGVSLARVLSR
jgi:CrcB protein